MHEGEQEHDRADDDDVAEVRGVARRACGPADRSEAGEVDDGRVAGEAAAAVRELDCRHVHVTAAPEYQATTTQLCGLFPFVAGSGTPTAGTPVGRHQLWGEVVCLDPLAWLRAGLVTNPGMLSSASPAPASPR